MYIDLPGVVADDIKIDLQRKVLTVSAEHSSTRTSEDQVYILERTQDRFQRPVLLGDGLDSGHIIGDHDETGRSPRRVVPPRACTARRDFMAPALADASPSLRDWGTATGGAWAYRALVTSSTQRAG